MTIIGLVFFIVPGLYFKFRFTYPGLLFSLKREILSGGSLDNLWNEPKEVHWSFFNAGVLLTLITISFVLILYAVLGNYRLKMKFSGFKFYW
ncbi:MAG: hypothetical protein Ct9H90mP22_8350 [Gammaproteobacteria bacterium]|nr:MAG: hypothetical protein Ct9H90mP22_8350 [Gammaproteobacteria bacterium]